MKKIIFFIAVGLTIGLSVQAQKSLAILTPRNYWKQCLKHAKQTLI